MLGKIIGWVVIGLLALLAVVFALVKRDFLKECYQELKKVSWPTREVALNSAIITVLFVIIFSLFLAVLDFGINQVFLGVVK